MILPGATCLISVGPALTGERASAGGHYDPRRSQQPQAECLLRGATHRRLTDRDQRPERRLGERSP